jgi:Cu/Ag efflux protein CusF
MGRKVAAVMAVLLVIALGATAMAQGLQKVTGTVTRIDKAAQSVAIQPQEGAVITIIMQDADKLSKIQEGAKVEVRYRVKDGKNVGIWIHNAADEGCS